MEEEDADNDDASSVRSSSQPLGASQASSSQASPSHVKDSRSTRPKALRITAKRVDEAILMKAGQMALNQSVQDQLAALVQGGSNDQITWCQWMGLEVNKLSEDLWMSFMQESFSMILHFRQLQQQQQVLPPPQQPPSILECSNSSSLPLSTPPVHLQSVVSPPFWQQQHQQQQWQTSLDLQPPQSWSFTSLNLSQLNTSGLSSLLDQAVGPGHGSISQVHTPEAVRTETRTSDILASAVQVLEQE